MSACINDQMTLWSGLWPRASDFLTLGQLVELGHLRDFENSDLP